MRSEAESAGLPAEDISKEGASDEGGSESKPGGPGSEEMSLPETKEKSDKKIVWMVEDNASYAQAALSAGKIFEKAFNLVHFETGEGAIMTLRSIIEQQGRLPDTILMDYQLDQGVENPKYHTGADVIRDLQKLVQDAKVNMPEIIGISGDKGFSERLLEAGAVRAEDKLKMFELFKKLANEDQE